MIKAILEQKLSELPDVTTYTFQPEEPVEWQAGQFLEYHLTHELADDRGQKRYFTISSAPYQQKIKITTRLDQQRSSTFKVALDQLLIGDSIEISEPMGEFVINNPQANHVLIAGGIGITPFHSILLDLVYRQQPINMTLLYANRNDQIVFKSELEAIAADNPGFKIRYFIADQQIQLADISEAAGSPDQHTSIYISGPKSMVGTFKQQLLDAGYTPSQIQTDYFPGYKNA